jgi:hypothetical protein
MLVSVTRLRIRSIPAYFQFLAKNEEAVRQVVSSPGFVRGKLLVDGIRTFWTATVWRDETSMRAYRGTGAHAALMPRLAGWCDEGSVTHWTQESDELPDWLDAHRRMSTQGRPSRVDRPSRAHQAGIIARPRVLIQRPLKPAYKT